MRPRQTLELTGEESWQLLSSVSLGRVVFTSHAMPAIRPVNHLVDDQTTIIRSHLGSAIAGRAAGTDGAVVCYEADELDPAWNTGWSVITTGMAQLVRDPAAISRYQQQLEPWAEGQMDHVITIRRQPATGPFPGNCPSSRPARKNSAQGGADQDCGGRSASTGRTSVQTQQILPAVRGRGFRAYSARQLDRLLARAGLGAAERLALRAVAAVVPFRANDYVIEHLIDWTAAPDDPIYRLFFPQPGMLPEHHVQAIAGLLAEHAPGAAIRAAADAVGIRAHPGQPAPGTPQPGSEPVPGLRHEYPDTILISPRQGQASHGDDVAAAPGAAARRA